MPAYVHVAPGDSTGLLTALAVGFGPTTTYGRVVIAACECGEVRAIRKCNWTSRHTKSCGCLIANSKVANLSHGHCTERVQSPTYKSWASMKSRVRGGNPHPTYQNLTMDPRWEKFENFLADMGERPEGTSIDRINNDDGYWPSNCRWATATEQSSNRRSWA